MRPSSRSVKIKFAHVAKDGRTPIINTVTGRWTYSEAPTAVQMTASTEKLTAIGALASEASTKATVAKTAADAAKETAESKVTLSEVQESLFPATDKDGKAVVMTSLTFTGSADGWGMQFCYHPVGKPDQGTCAAIAYVSKSSFDALEQRVKDLEAKVKS